MRFGSVNPCAWAGHTGTPPVQEGKDRWGNIPVLGVMGGWRGVWAAGGGSFLLGSPGTSSEEDAPELPHASATKFSRCHLRAEIGYRRLTVMEGKVAELPSRAGTHQEQSQQQLQLRSAAPEHLRPAGWG